MLNSEDKRVTEHGLSQAVQLWLMRSARKLAWLSWLCLHENQWPRIQSVAPTFLQMFQLLPISRIRA